MKQQKMELVWAKGLEESLPAELEFNYNELKTALETNLKTFTEALGDIDLLPLREARANRASLNALRQRLDDERKRIKKQLLEPYDRMEAKIKELLAIIDNSIEPLTEVINAEEQRRKDEKSAEIAEFFEAEAKAEDLESLVKIENVWNDRWLNVTYNFGEIKHEIKEFLKKVDTELASISSFCEGNRESYLARARSDYLRFFDLNKVIADITQAEKDAQELAKREQRNAELAKARELEAQKLAQVQAEAVRVQEQVEKETAESVKTLDEKVEPILVYRLEVKGTYAQLAGLGIYLKANKIEYEKI